VNNFVNVNATLVDCVAENNAASGVLFDNSSGGGTLSYGIHRSTITGNGQFGFGAHGFVLGELANSHFDNATDFGPTTGGVLSFGDNYTLQNVTFGATVARK
jgi:hypothetical protein